MTAIGVLGTGIVGRTIGTRLAALGHDVTLGARSSDNEAAAAWAAETGGRHGTFADAAAAGELLLNCTTGEASVDALRTVDPGDLAGKTLIDVANAFHIVDGRVELVESNTDSLAERIQRACPDARVVKALNTVNAAVMVDPSTVAGDHVVFVCGDDDAKAQTRDLLRQFGWPDERVLDLGGIVAARAVEMYLPLWLTLMRTLGTPSFNIAIQRGA